MKIKTIQTHKSIPENLEFNLPDFSIITGKNGSGKSHLLEIMADTKKSIITKNNFRISNITHVEAGKLSPKIDAVCDDNKIRALISKTANQISPLIKEFSSKYKKEDQTTANLKKFLDQKKISATLIKAIIDIIEKSRKNFSDLNDEDLFKFINVTHASQEGIFGLQFSLIFKAYHKRVIENEFNKFLAKTHSDIKYFSDDDFSDLYGPPPWDLINEIMDMASLPYSVIAPKITERDAPYTFSLKDVQKSITISPMDLSSGEKILMSLALAIYNTNNDGLKPDLLLLDEPDAPLHPQFSKLFIEIISKTIVKKAGVNVVITTHSPSTVATSPDNTIFEISRDTKLPTPVSNIYAVEILTSGLDFLKVKNENRKQVFVESKYDVLYYQTLYQILSRRKKFIYTPIFLEPHTGSSNCHDVKSIVKRLRDSGSDLVHGIIDYDLINKPDEFISILGNGNRYSIENYILDPIMVALALIRCGKMEFKDFGVHGKLTYIDSQILTADECQSMVDSLLIKCRLNIDELTEVKLENDFTIKYPKSFTNHNGHDFEKKLKTEIPEILSTYKGQGEDKLKMAILEIAAENSHLISKDLGATFDNILNLTDKSINTSTASKSSPEV